MKVKCWILWSTSILLAIGFIVMMLIKTVYITYPSGCTVGMPPYSICILIPVTRTYSPFQVLIFALTGQSTIHLLMFFIGLSYFFLILLIASLLIMSNLFLVKRFAKKLLLPVLIISAITIILILFTVVFSLINMDNYVSRPRPFLCYDNC